MKVLLLILLSIGCISAKRFAIMAPNVFHIGVNEQVSIAVFDAGNPVNVKLYLQDYPHRQKTFSQVQGQVKPDQGHLFLSVKVEPENLPDIASVDKQYVYLVAKSDDAHYQFHKEAKILLSYNDGMVFIQTDKPIYTPKQKVEIRVIPLEFDMKPSRKQITVVVENPQGIRVRQWKNLDTRTGIISKRIHLDENILLGNWTITALYGHRDIHNTSVKFEVTEYVLPKFSVKLSVPPFIMKTDNDFRIYIAARYTFGKPVLGNARVNLDIVGMNGTTFSFARPVITLDRSGNTTLTEKVQNIKDLPGNIWFPEKSRLHVQVEVIERATGSKESAEDNSCLFTSSPYIVEFKNTPNYFKPGFPFRAKAVVTHPNKKPAVGVRVLMAANFTRGKDKSMEVNQKFDRDDPNSMGHTDLNGEVDFAINTQSNYHLIIIKVKTDDDRLEEKYNGVANKVVKPFNTNGSFIMIRQNVKKGSVKVNDKMECELFHSDQAGAVSPKKLSFAVVSRGRILSHNTAIALNGGKSKTWQFYVTPQMSPSARLIGYYIDSNGNVVADSILLDVEDSLPTKVEFRKPGKDQIFPGAKLDLSIDTTAGTRLGVVIVDESVYLLRDKNRLTKERIFKAAEDLDLGCGVGGGKDSKDIFKNAGVVLMTDNFVSGARRDYGCSDDESRKKRSVEDDLEEKICCDMARDTENVTCVRLAFDSNKDLSYRCKNAFWKCCIKLHGEEDAALLGRSAGFEYGKELEDSISQSQVRKYFPEAWFYEEFDVGSSGVFSQTITLPGTITTWVMQAVAINNQTGLGLATPLRIVSEKNFFVTLKMPYSVKRGEQVSLVATVFNYDQSEIDKLLQVKLYLKGDKDFCSIASDNKYEFIGIINVPANDAGSVTVPIIPKIVGEVNVEVMAIGTILGFVGATGGMDAVRKPLLVVPEGKEHRKSQTLVLDPSGNLNDGAKNGKDSFQSDEIELKVPDLKKAIPNSLEAMLYVSGNLVGPVVNTTIEGGLERFIRQPTGCGEQNMIYLAPNVYVLEYLMNTKQVTGANEKNAYRFIQSGYERELNYRRDDKSFSAFGNDRPGSTWLTAFVMRVFCKIQEFPGIDIDEKLLCDSVNWLIQNQREDGALPEINMVIHREMVGGVYTEGDVAMTAFVVSTLAECKCKGVNTVKAIQRATDYLERQYQTLNRPYSMALTAYAMSLVNSTKKIGANDRLVQNAIYDSAKKSRHWNAGGNALNVETAGYALLTQVQLGRTGYAGPIVTYLTNQRKGGIGFVSTQDTVVALQALALYSERTAGKSLDLRVKLESEDARWKPAEIHITPENALLRRQYDVTRFLDGKLFVDTRGTGVGLLEVDFRYNLPASRNETCNFDLRKTVTEIKEKDGVKKKGGQSSDEPRKNKGEERKKARGAKNGCKGKKRKKCKNKPVEHEPVTSMNLRVCTRYRKKNYTGMSIMDIGILSGFRPNQQSLENLKDNLTEFDKVEVSDASMVVYLSEIPNDRELCVDVQFDREYHVGVVQAVPINVYDYYEPDESCTVFYGPDKFSPLKMGVCDVGSKSCKCTQDQCAQHDPAIRSSAKLTSLACLNVYHYAFKGKVLYISEQNSDVLYFVKVKKIIKQGNQKLKKNEKVTFYKRASCVSPDLEESSQYLFMGKDEKAGRYELDKTSFVKLWRPASNKDRRPASNKDKRVLDEFAKNFNCS